MTCQLPQLSLNVESDKPIAGIDEEEEVDGELAGDSSEPCKLQIVSPERKEKNRAVLNSNRNSTTEKRVCRGGVDFGQDFPVLPAREGGAEK